MEKPTFDPATEQLEVRSSLDPRTGGRKKRYVVVPKKADVPPPVPPLTIADMVRDECTTLINKKFPDWKQRNMLARRLQLQVDPTLGTPEEVAYIDSVWAWVQAMRAESNSAPAEGRYPKWPKFPV